jgi:UDP-2-acetamido-3-amino-2,3-dideoxy-glucuronate N-acetyltransferase
MNDYFVHSTSVVDYPCQIGRGTKIWHYCHISEGVVLGEDCVLGQNVFVGKNVKIGDHVKIQNNVSVYDGVTIEDDVFLGPSCVFTNVKHPRSFTSRNGKYDKTFIKKGATIGANATIVCGITINEYAFIGAGAVVTKDVEPYTIVYGNPAQPHGKVDKRGQSL